ncbi:hypothetical protein SVA_2667 [Sulfurifustis variabilis]|uniref:Uncharacterized protein n=1 Tax=Sulfurifustis variabilis TaxID=1675686 RepID=A0A1B4V6Z0_9GAMM|nr:hypothetical protein [Sulfurifustis variabilis]BAU49215.1 hypothetical protein SVA_2667 [Sulfurifustis variabilis]
MKAPHFLSVSVALLALGFIAESRATVLTFDETRSATGSTVIPTTSGSSVQQDYGDNVTGSSMDVTGGQFTYGNDGEGFTPNVVVDYSSGTAVSLWTTQYGDLTNVAFANSLPGTTPNALNVLLTADPGYEVQLYHFDLAGWSNTDYVIDGVSVFGDSLALYSQADVLVQGDIVGPRHTAFDFATPLSAQQLLIEIDFGNLAGGFQDNIGIDNIRFGQTPPVVVPVPPAAWLFFSALVGLAGMARRKTEKAPG